MKNTKTYFGLALLAITGTILVAADHIDAPSTTGTSADIADFYAFEPTTGSDNTVFIVDLQSSVLPDLAYGTFDENVLTEINIDLDGDLVEDQVIQAIPRDGVMYFFGPVAPSQKGLDSQVLVGAPLGSVEISATTAKTTTTASGVKLFAGPRQDAFFFDFFQFNKVLTATPEGFLAPGDASDTFDGANTMSIAIDIPNAMLGTPTATNALGVVVYKTWVTSNIKQ
ncbi:DUF4331 family protein [Cellulophaga sp. E16_2]|uniref:DUF4331 domain-containing protein n=1 Tax=Cellulophaga algicola (strain DSM 14237 / IC166 / ACAM 630) TaxID=688270 RepID=E6X7V2_CELAD|nr:MULTISPECIES: DUF4331 family protein [Cellulophaga]ADV47545.1 hypothetical protein Celal_0194 [Cellulophaga algicola DSM 14237]MBO0589936.1 DUF4331 family protein [Cellulophaga sp. E16_2]